jgi:hypothetical protein
MIETYSVFPPQKKKRKEKNIKKKEIKTGK